MDERIRCIHKKAQKIYEENRKLILFITATVFGAPSTLFRTWFRSEQLRGTKLETWGPSSCCTNSNLSPPFIHVNLHTHVSHNKPLVLFI